MTEKEKDLKDRKNKAMEARSQGFTGDQCYYCGSFKLIVNGACRVCVDCGNTGSCG